MELQAEIERLRRLLQLHAGKEKQRQEPSNSEFSSVDVEQKYNTILLLLAAGALSREELINPLLASPTYRLI